MADKRSIYLATMQLISNDDLSKCFHKTSIASSFGSIDVTRFTPVHEVFHGSRGILTKFVIHAFRDIMFIIHFEYKPL